MTVISLRSTIISQYGISKAADYNDSVIYYFRHGDFQFDLTENIVLTLKTKIDCLDSLHRYKDAYEAYKEYSVLLDSARTRSMENKVEDLEIKKYVDELVVEKKALEIDLQKEPEPVISIPRVAHSFDLLRNLHILPPRKDQIAIQGIAGIEPAGHYRQ